MPGGKVFFGQSGSEAVDTALKLARAAQVQGRPPGEDDRDLSLERLSRHKLRRHLGSGVRRIPRGLGWTGARPRSCARQRHRGARHGLCRARRSCRRCHRRTAAGRWGCHPACSGIPRSHSTALLPSTVRSTSAMRSSVALVALGQWFGAKHYGIEPDLVTFAKAVTSGYVPLSGVIVGERALGMLEKQPGMEAQSRLHLLGPPDRLRGSAGLHRGDRGRRASAASHGAWCPAPRGAPDLGRRRSLR